MKHIHTLHTPEITIIIFEDVNKLLLPQTNTHVRTRIHMHAHIHTHIETHIFIQRNKALVFADQGLKDTSRHCDRGIGGDKQLGDSLQAHTSLQ